MKLSDRELTDSIRAALNRQAITPLEGDMLERVVNSLKSNEPATVYLSKTIIPERDIDSYHVIALSKYDGQAYYSGQEMKELQSFRQYDDALKFLRKELDKSLKRNDGNDFHLLLHGRYKGEQLQLGYDGTPVQDTGIFLSIGSKLHPGILHIHKPSHEITILQPVAMEYDSTNNRLLLQKVNYQGFDQLNVKAAGNSSAGEFNQPGQPFIQTNSNVKVMDENTERFNENQFKRIGFADAYTPDVIARMERGESPIKHPHVREYENDGKATSMLHLKKGASSDRYYINKFDMEAKPQGPGETIKQTFFINRKETNKVDEQGNKITVDLKWTQKEAFNYLRRRPVLQDFVSKDGEHYQARALLEKNREGKYEMKQYGENYGFKLNDVLQKYSIADLDNGEREHRLVAGLDRGNKQTVDFVDRQGNVDKLQVSINIKLGALNVYGADGKQIPIPQLIEKGYVQKEFGEKLLETIKQIQAQKNVINRDNQQTVDAGNKQNVANEQGQNVSGHKHKNKIT